MSSVSTTASVSAVAAVPVATATRVATRAVSHGRNGALDVLRALAIVLVVNCHGATSFAPDSWWKSVLQLGGHGVDLFFVLSGWLLGRQLCLELRDSGAIDVRRFWFRRWMRTLPAYYAVLALTLLTQIVLHDNWSLGSSYLYFGQTYLTDLRYFGISWSLCVEEHFYLLIAPLLLLLFRGRALLPGLLVVFLIPLVLRQILTGYHPEQTHVRFDGCIAGVGLAALSVFAPRVWSALGRVSIPLAAVGAGAFGLNLMSRAGMNVLAADWGPFALALIFGALLLGAVAQPRHVPVAVIPVMRYLADRAYAVYLLHPEAIAVVKRLGGFGTLPFALDLILTWALSLALAELLFQLLERPVMHMREWFAASRSRDANITAAA